MNLTGEEKHSNCIAVVFNRKNYYLLNLHFPSIQKELEQATGMVEFNVAEFRVILVVSQSSAIDFDTNSTNFSLGVPVLV